MTTTPTLLRKLAAGASAAAFTAIVAAVPLTAQASPKMMAHGKMSHKMMHSKQVYACAECKMYYTPSQAKAMKYMDPMGHKLSKMSKAPAGFVAGGKMMDKDKMMDKSGTM